MSPGNGYFFPHIGEAKQIHIKAPLTSLCSFVKPLLQNPHHIHSLHFTKKTLLKNISSVISMVVFTEICVSHFYFQMIFRNSVWCDMPRNKGWHTTICCILNT